MIRTLLAVSAAVLVSGCFALFEPKDEGVREDGSVVGDDGLVLQTSPSESVESGELAPPPPADE